MGDRPGTLFFNNKLHAGTKLCTSGSDFSLFESVNHKIMILTMRPDLQLNINTDIEAKLPKSL